MPLSELIINKIKQYGPISFCIFMEMALYYPGLGYYMSGKNRIGKDGDFYTSPNVTAVFGEMIGKQIVEMQQFLKEPVFTVVEMGAGTGLLSLDVLIYLEKNLSCEFDYCIIEKSPALREVQKKRLGEKARWVDSILELSGMTGCVFSNELVDAFPVHLIQMENELMEVHVGYKNGKFIEVLKPATEELIDYFSELNVVLPQGFRTEINLEGVKWIQDVASSIKKGYVITIDYGYPSSELYAEYRDSGTIMCYYRHTTGENPYNHAGEQDITSHVNFSALDHWGQKFGLELCGFTDQAHFLLGLGIEKYLENLQKNHPENYLKMMLQVKSIMMDMGEMFKILIQAKGVNLKELSGLREKGRWKL
jgi:SAM-dependent MidA family methyltransferase